MTQLEDVSAVLRKTALSEGLYVDGVRVELPGPMTFDDYKRALEPMYARMADTRPLDVIQPMAPPIRDHLLAALRRLEAYNQEGARLALAMKAKPKRPRTKRDGVDERRRLRKAKHGWR